MIDETILQSLIEAGGVGGTIVAVSLIFRAVFMRWLENIGAARKLDAERLTAERASEQALAIALNGVTTELKLSRGINEQMIDQFGLLATRDHLVLVHSDVKTIPREVWRMGDPKLNEMQSGIERKIAELQTDIAGVDAMTARQAIQHELDLMNMKLSDIQKAIQVLPTEKKTNTKHPDIVTGEAGDQSTEDTTKRTA